MLAFLNLLRRAKGNHISFIEHHDPVGNQKRAGEFVRDHYHRHVKSAFQFQNQFVNFGGHNRV